MCIDFELKAEAYVTANALNITVIANSYNLWYFFIIKLIHSHVHGNLVSRANAVILPREAMHSPVLAVVRCQSVCHIRRKLILYRNG